jgi:HAD superfamily hydrolase (TIGR01549 family)
MRVLMSTRYRTVFLDAGGVLVYPNWQRAAEALARHGVLVAPATLAAAEPAVKRSLDVAPTVRATNDSQRGFLYFDRILKETGVDRSDATDAALADLKAFNDVEGTWDHVSPDAVATLTRLRDAGLQIVVVSNSNGTLRRLFGRIGLAPHVDLLIDSTEEQVEKPNPRLFQIALDRSGADRSTTIHCGDLYEIDVVGARAAGLPAVLLDTAGIYGEVDCPRVLSLTEYADGLIAGRFDQERV